MKVLTEYTIASMRKNRGSSISVMAAVLVVTTMMSALCGYLYNIYIENLNLIINESGNWHGELFDNTYGEYLPAIKEFKSVESTMIKGKWMTAQIDDPRRQYLVYRDANEQYWQSMPEKNGILEGRIPAAPNEIALSKQYFEHHPELKLGDTLSLPSGQRIKPDGTPIEPNDRLYEGEKFVQNGGVNLKVVGKLDVATSSIVPAYTAIGYLDDSSIKPDDNITVYLRFKSPRDTYKELPKIAEAVGYEKDEYGYYNLRYNMKYLMRIFVFSHDQRVKISSLDRLGMPLTYLGTGLITVIIFVLIIHNAFALSANIRLSQIGIFASIGATPRQIKRSVLLEAFLLSVIPMPFGLFIGQFLIKLMIDYVNKVNVLFGEEPISFIVSFMSILPAIILTLITVWWSALIPARRISKLSPISAIRQGESGKLKKPHKHSFFRILGIEWELAGNAVRARSRSYGTAITSLLLSFLVLFSIPCARSASKANEEIYDANGYLDRESDISLSLYSARNQSDREVMDEISSIDGIKSSVWSVDLRTAVWLSPDMLSEEFKAAGGFDSAEKEVNTGYLLKRDGKIRAPSVIIGLDDETFSKYCQENGISAQEADNIKESEIPKAILYNNIEDVTVSTLRNPVYIPYLLKGKGDTINFTEKYNDDVAGDYSFNVEIAAESDSYPPIGRRYITSRYGIMMFMPMSQADKLSSRFALGGIDKVNGVFLAQNGSNITDLHTEIEKMCESWFGSGDYYIRDKVEYDMNKQNESKMMNIIVGFIIGLLAVIGLSSTWAVVLGSINLRRREFAMLRSMGIPPIGVFKMLAYEGVVLGIMPLLLGAPLCMVLLAILLNLNEVSLMQWLPYAPIQPVLIYIVCIAFAVLLSYMFGAKNILKQNITDVIKTDTM